MFSSLILSLMFAALAGAQSYANVTASTISPSTTVNGTAVANPAAFVTSIQISIDDFWELAVGPVSSANTTTTVEPTAVPASSLIPPPFLTKYPFPPDQQVPISSENQSWSFPKDFMLGVSGAAFQIEGAARAEGKGPSVWDKLEHRIPNYVVDNQTGDIADNNYYMYKQDIARVAAIGVNTYSFSLAWTRLLPFGSGPVNELGIAHYNDVIDTCLQYNLTPVITLFHWDTPLFLQQTYGGWLNDQIAVDFTEYARLAYSRFGDRVKHWYTINEPSGICGQWLLPAEYFNDFDIPPQHQGWVCGRSIVLAHANAYRLGKSMMPDSVISFKNNGGYKIPLTNSTEDAEAVQRAWDFNEGWFANPIFLGGTWPASVDAYVSSFLPAFTAEQQALINGTADVFAHDAYTAQFYMAPDAGIAACTSDPSNPLFPGCFNTTYTYAAADGGWNIGPAADQHSFWLHAAPSFLPLLLAYIESTWRPPLGIVVSEFGFAEPFEAQKTLLADILYDPVRTAYYREYMRALLAAMGGGARVLGTLAWSFLDNLEWNEGFTVKFGLQHVNFTSPGLERSYKASFFEYTGIFREYVEK